MKNTALIITTIAPPTRILKLWAKECQAQAVSLILIGDKASPVDFRLTGSEYFSLNRQAHLPFRLSHSLPVGHYARKNLGYLQAIHQGATTIIETDDDNQPSQGFWRMREMNVNGFISRRRDWLNVYRYFSAEKIWPRGFPLDLVQTSFASSSLTTQIKKIRVCPIQQALADENPDVDAVYRMTQKLPVRFKKKPPLILATSTFCPFNSQNTTWFTPAFPLLYLPAYCSMRMTDIWRSLIAERILWECGWSISFHAATLTQQRNTHSLLKDFADEIPGYLRNQELAEHLRHLQLKPGAEYIGKNLVTCYQSLIKEGFFPSTELKLVKDWLADLKLKI